MLDRAIAKIGWENTDIRIAVCVALLLAEFRNAPRTGYPAVLTSKEEWDRILERMWLGFEIASKKEVLNEKEEEILNESLNLLARWFRHLWD